jgi:predicted GIY-YIG superfamily endonuclease
MKANAVGTWFCYLIKSVNPEFMSRTYVGVTNNPKRRIRQHCGEIVGGAKSTAGKGPWEYVCLLHGFPTQQSALQFEWRVHHPPKKGRRGVSGRIKNMVDILQLEKWTKAATQVSPADMTVIWVGDKHECLLHEDMKAVKYEKWEDYNKTEVIDLTLD